MGKKILSIIIPTYRRSKELIYNLNSLEVFLSQLDCISKIAVLISADGSTAEHIRTIETFIAQSRIDVNLYVQEKNLGLSENELFLIGKVETEFAMLLGEDDYLNKELIRAELEYIENAETNGVSTIIPNFYGVDENRKRIRSPKRRIKNDIILNKRAINELYTANQMSALVFKTEGLYQSYKKMAPENVYPHLFFVGFSMTLGKTVRLTRHPFMNTYIPQKSFNYTYDGLTDQIIRIYLSLPYTDSEIISGIQTFLKKDIVRFSNFFTWTHPRMFIAKVRNEYDGVPDRIKRMIVKWFILSFFMIPYFVLKHYWVRLFKGSYNKCSSLLD